MILITQRRAWIMIGLLGAYLGLYLLFRPTYRSRAIELAFSFNYLKPNNVSARCFTDYDSCSYLGQYSGSFSNFERIVSELGLHKVESTDSRFFNILMTIASNEKVDLPFDQQDQATLYHRDLKALPQQMAYISCIYLTGTITVCASGTKAQLTHPRDMTNVQ